MRTAQLFHFPQYPAPNMAEICSAHEDMLDVQADAREESIAFQTKMFQATAAEKFVTDWIADPTADLIEFYHAFTVFGDDEAALGRVLKHAMLNRMREAAIFTVDQKR